ncbi:hypothetical protein [Leptospira koniambonensis]|uniref:8-oxoguanine DNA glycosylase OGG fold protein n=1 Tax=Leptospira koniambonensis TaxID=2484950 RepID=UPI003EB96935
MQTRAVANVGTPWSLAEHYANNLIMDIEKYRTLIQNLPYLDQSFIPHKSRWVKILYQSKLLYNLDEFAFEKGYSREDLLNMPVSKEKVIKMLMWGYPIGGRGRNISNLLSSTDRIVEILSVVYGQECDRQNIFYIIKELDSLNGMGRSTWSKLLYFNRTTFEGIPLLILDQKIERAVHKQIINDVKFPSFENATDVNSYLEYLQSSSILARKLKVVPDSLELFFFMFADVFRLGNVG